MARRKKGGSKDLATVAEELKRPFDEEVLENQRKIVAARESAYLARMEAVEKATFRDVKERDAWVEKKKRDLVVPALTDVELALRHGSSREREVARKEVLEMTGHARPEGNGVFSQPLIVIAGLENMTRLPWAREVKAITHVVDAEAPPPGRVAAPSNTVTSDIVVSKKGRPKHEDK